jgi:DNA-binding MarR family transcriptional regulator
MDLEKSDASLQNLAEDQPLYELIEELFFAYRDFVADPDRILAIYHFGRAHHRVLHFVDRRSGLSVAALLDLLRITKQSLNRVLKELLERGFIESRAGAKDRRQKLLFTTQQGHELAVKLAALQTQRLQRALKGLPPETQKAALTFLAAIKDSP